MSLNFKTLLGDYDKNYGDEFASSETESGIGGLVPIKSIQHGEIALAAGVTSNTDTITTVTTANSIVVMTGVGGYSGTCNSDDVMFKVVLTNATTVTATRHADAGAISAGYMVIEFNEGFVNLIQPNSGGTGTVTIVSVDTTKSIIFPQGVINTSAANDSWQIFYKTDLTNATTVTVDTDTDSTVYFVVVEFT